MPYVYNLFLKNVNCVVLVRLILLIGSVVIFNKNHSTRKLFNKTVSDEKKTLILRCNIFSNVG